jgi:hypothetical protein
MSTKTFKVGENGYHPVVKLVTRSNDVEVLLYDWDGNLDEVKYFGFLPSSLTAMELDMADECSSYYASLMIEWVKSTPHFKEYPVPVQDPFTTYTFN